MIEKINNLLNQIENQKIEDLQELENFRIKYLSKKGLINQLFSEFKNVPASEKKETGQKINILKNKAQEIFDKEKNKLSETTEKKQDVDLTLPGDSFTSGSRHPVSIVINQMISI
ncbi:MAG TPA: phenylalanine--tRNA ligase subunit alpha, partial [Bacteroidales bacterium]|nr:phenylalanine--tRNA ligase subunit alpha [Bacteroidales bacterium]